MRRRSLFAYSRLERFHHSRESGVSEPTITATQFPPLPHPSSLTFYRGTLSVASTISALGMRTTKPKAVHISGSNSMSFLSLVTHQDRSFEAALSELKQLPTSVSDSGV